jgi:CubicO group peptidase (beta-lactamase class C family)
MQRQCFPAFILASCIPLLASLGLPAAAQDRQIPVWPTTEWQTAAPEDGGMASSDLAKLVEFGKSLQLDSLLIARHGRIVLEAYYAPYNGELPHLINSSTKAVVGSLIAMLLKDGTLDSLDHPVLDFFPGRDIANLDERKQAITVRHLLNMTSGLDWDEGLGGGKEQSLLELRRSPDWVQYILDRPSAHAPGETFYYNSGGSHLLSAIITKLTGKSAADYANEKLFGPLGIAAPAWGHDPQGISTGGFGLWLKPRDMARFGYLYLRGGKWGEQQLLPPDWIEAVNHPATDMRTSFEPGLRYANQFWALPDRQMYMSVGYHCQVVMVLPDPDIVAVMTARDFCPFRKLVNDMSAAVKSDNALPAAPDAAASLAQAVNDAATEKPSDPGVPSDLMSTVSGKTYDFPRNPLIFKTVTLFLNDPNPHMNWDLYQPDAPDGVIRTESPIGLDGLFRKNAPKNPSALFAYRAMKGAWRDKQTFVVDLQFIGMGEQRTWTFRFEGDKLMMTSKGRDNRDVTIEGKIRG